MRCCEECGAEFLRADYAREGQWLSKRFCDGRCSALNHHKRRGHTMTETDEQQMRTADSIATGNLLKALISYGLKHNTDLGMGREAFFARAEECGFTTARMAA